MAGLAHVQYGNEAVALDRVFCTQSARAKVQAGALSLNNVQFNVVWTCKRTPNTEQIVRPAPETFFWLRGKVARARISDAYEGGLRGAGVLLMVCCPVGFFLLTTPLSQQNVKCGALLYECTSFGKQTLLTTRKNPTEEIHKTHIHCDTQTNTHTLIRIHISQRGLGAP